MDGIGWYLGGMRYRAPYGANIQNGRIITMVILVTKIETAIKMIRKAKVVAGEFLDNGWCTGGPVGHF